MTSAGTPSYGSDLRPYPCEVQGSPGMHGQEVTQLFAPETGTFENLMDNLQNLQANVLHTT